MGRFKIINECKTGDWVLIEHYLPNDQHPIENKWVSTRAIRQDGMKHAFDAADSQFDPTVDDKTDPLIR